MRYIFTALKPEAQAFVDKFKLKKSRVDSFTIFSNSDMRVILSGLGVQKMREACDFAVKNYTISKLDTCINVGICASDSRHKIGELLEIGTVSYNGLSYALKSDSPNRLTCLDYEATDEKYELVDMESFGFYEQLKERDSLYIFKVVSDHFEPKTVTKEKTKALIFNAIDELFKKVKQ